MLKYIRKYGTAEKRKGNTKMKEKRYFVNEDYPAETWNDILGLTREAARRILNDEEFAEWCKDREAQERAYQERAKKELSNKYFPGCYGDPLMDC